MTRQQLSRDDAIDRLEALEQRVDDLEGLVSALRTQNKHLKTALAGSPSEFATWDVDAMPPLKHRVVKMEDQLAEHDAKFEMFVVEDGAAGTPDERAMHLRQVLANKARQVADEQDDRDAEATMTREQCETALGSTVSRAQVLDAMKRAADGSAAADAEAVEYTPIQGSSDLQPVDAVGFTTGSAVNNRGDPEQSHLSLSVADLTGTDLRKNHMTVNGDGGA